MAGKGGIAIGALMAQGVACEFSACLVRTRCWENATRAALAGDLFINHVSRPSVLS